VQDGAYIKDFWGRAGVSVAADIQVVIVFGDFSQGDDF
jgi:hypothetical protein